MISIIISSIDKKMLENVSKNIENTIGVPYEILSYENSNGERGICAVYNQGIKEAKYNILCLMHEDIFIKTDNWGNTIKNIFANNPGLGLIGVAGGNYKSLAPSGWDSAAGGMVYANFIQFFKYQQQESFHHYLNPGNKTLAPVICIDGLWMCVPKPIALECGFDEKLLKKFHGYDIDFSLAVGQKYSVAVTFEVLLAHYSEGQLDKNWMSEIIKLYNKWCRHLPATTEEFSYKQTVNFEKANFKRFLKTIKELDIPASIAFKILWSNNRYILLNFKLFVKLNFYTLLNYFSRLS